MIKFRYYDPVYHDSVNGEMIYSDSKLSLSQFFLEFEEAQANGNNPVLMRYTELEDSEGNEIYEGDIVICNPFDKEVVSLVLWRKSEFSTAGFRLSVYGENELKIVGNQCENESLLRYDSIAD